MIDAVSRSVRGRFEEFQVSVAFKNLPVIFDVAMWPKEEKALQYYGDQAIRELKEFYEALLPQTFPIVTTLDLNYISSSEGKEETTNFPELGYKCCKIGQFVLETDAKAYTFEDENIIEGHFDMRGDLHHNSRCIFCN